MYYVVPEENLMRATKPELIGKIRKLERSVGDLEHDLAGRDDELKATHDSLEKTTKERDEAIKERDAFKVELAGAGGLAGQIKAEVDATKVEIKKLQVEIKRERILAKVVRKERDLYRSILKAIAWELDQPGMKVRNPWSMSWAPILGYSALAALGPLTYLLTRSKKAKKTGDAISKQGVGNADYGYAEASKATSAMFSSVMSGKTP